jgi:hypothetical protein
MVSLLPLSISQRGHKLPAERLRDCGGSELPADTPLSGFGLPKFKVIEVDRFWQSRASERGMKKEQGSL